MSLMDSANSLTDSFDILPLPSSLYLMADISMVLSSISIPYFNVVKVEFSDHIRVYVTPDDFRYGHAFDIIAKLKKMNSEYKGSYYRVALMYRKFVMDLLYAPFTEKEYLEGEKQFKEFQEGLLSSSLFSTIFLIVSSIIVASLSIPF